MTLSVAAGKCFSKKILEIMFPLKAILMSFESRRLPFSFKDQRQTVDVSLRIQPDEIWMKAPSLWHVCVH